MFLITKSNRFLLKYLFNFLCFVIFGKYIQSLDINIQGDEIFDHKEIQFKLTSSKNYIIYRYKLNQEKTNFILQLNSISNIPITIYFYNNNSLNYEDNGDFYDWDNEYTSYTYINKTEFLFQSYQRECYIVFTIKKEYKQNYTDFSGSFNIFQIPVDISLNDFYKNKSYFYHIYNNNYTLKDYNNNYIYRINSHNLNFNNNNEIYLHCVIQSTGAEHSIIIENDDNEIIYNKKNLSNLDYYLNIAKSKIYNIKLISEKNIPFSILFEIMHNKINYIGNNNTICINKLGKSNYYFYDEISKGNIDEPLYYILNNYFSKNDIRVGFYRPTNIINLENVTNEELYQISLNGEYTQMQSKHETNDIDIYKYNIEKKNITNSIFFIQIKVNKSLSLNLDKICFKKLPLIKLDLGSLESYKTIYNSTYKLENIGYYYIKYNTSIVSSYKIFLYTSKIDTLTLYKGKADIVELNNKEGILCKKKMVEISSEIITDKGYTIKLINKNDFSFAFEIINTSINNFIETSIDINKEHPNKEFYINNTIKELFLLNNINYSSNNEEIIIESKVIYGNLTLKYFNLDGIENDFDFDIKNIFYNNNNAYLGFIDIEYPILSNSSLEIIKIINNNYESKIFSEGLLYINRYHQYNNNITKNILKPFYLIKNEVKSIEIDNYLNSSSFNYQISLDSKYLNILGQSYITIKIGEQVLYLNKEDHILKGKINYPVNNNIIIENSSNKYNFLIWIKLYVSDYEENNYPIIIPFSKSYYIDKIQNNKNYIFSFDWPNFLNCLQNDEKYISFNYFCIRIIYDDDNDDNNKNNYNYISKIYHYQIIEDNNYLNNEFYLYNSINSSIENEITPKKSLSLFQQNYDESKFKQFLTTNKALYTIINMPEQNPNVKLNFYVSYIYKEILEPNSLKLFEFSENISSLDINITKPQSYSKDIFFQALFCSDTPEKQISFLYSNNTESDYKKSDIVLTKLSTSNYYGKITLKKLPSINYYFNIFLPKKMYFRYLYYDNDYLLYNKYNNFYLNDDKADYNIEIERQGNKIIISFNVLNRNEITNYTVLIKNNEEEKILNECQFISLLSSNKGKNNYIVNYFIDKGNTQKVKAKIDIEKNGNYDIYILAQEINDFNLYKFIGYKEYNFTKSKIDENSNTSSNMVTFLVISNILLLLLIIGIIIYIIYKKNKNRKIINSLSNSLLEKELSSTKDNEKYEKPSTNENSEEINNSISNIQDSNFNILNKEAPLVNGSINDSFDNKSKNIIMINNKDDNNNNNNYNNTEKGDNRNNDEDASESAAPAFNFIKTQNPDENNIGYIFAERNQVKDEQKDDDALKKVFVNVETTKA